MLEWGNGEVAKKDKKNLDTEAFFKEVYFFLSKYDEFIFKGASLVYFINSGTDNNLMRYTRDVDICNLGKSKEEIKELCKELLLSLEKNYDMSGFIYEEDNRTIDKDFAYILNLYDGEKYKNAKTKKEIRESIIYNIDFSESKYFEQDYSYSLFGVEINGYDINKIISDKLVNISTKKIFSRNKDMIDIYRLSFNKKYKISYEKIKYFNNLKDDIEMENFEYLFTNREDLKKLMSGLSGVNFEDFGEDIYDKILNRISDFVSPFLNGGGNLNELRNVYWNPDKGVWEKEF